MPLQTNLDQYVKLRTMLDSAAIGSLRYYLNATSSEQQQRHYDYLYSHLERICERVWGIDKNTPALDITCPDGYFPCDGCCVPYECVGGTGGSDA